MRRHVERSSNYRLHDCFFTIEALGEPKITYLANAALHENIGGLQVSMDNAVLMEILGAIHDIPKILLGLIFGDPPSPLQQPMQIAILAELSNDIHIVSSLVDIVEPNDVLVADLLHYVDLRLNVFDVVGIREYFLVDDLDCHWLG